MANRVVLKGDRLRKEALAGGGITPGHLVELTATGTVVVHATAGGAVQPRAIAVEKEYLGKDLNSAYVANDQVYYEILQDGAEFQGLVAAGTAAIAKDALVESAGNGTVRTLAAGVACARALEAVDNSGGGSAVRIKLEVV